MKARLTTALAALALLASAQPGLAAVGRLHLASAAAQPVTVAINGHDYGKLGPGQASAARIAFSGGEAELPAVLTADSGAAVHTTLWLSEESAVHGADGLHWCVKVGADFAVVMAADDCERLVAREQGAPTKP